MSDFEAHFEPERKGPMVFAFASENDHRFEWGTYLDGINVPHAMFRDSSDQWYAYGVPGFGDIDSVVKYIHSLAMNNSGCIALGLSKGAYAALKLAKLSGIPKVIAISPVTGCGDYVFGEFAPHWHHRIEHKRPFPIEDLKPYYSSGRIPTVKSFISDGDGCELDKQMCERIGLSDITIVPGFTHSSLARGMRDNGMMDKLINDSRSWS